MVDQKSLHLYKKKGIRIMDKIYVIFWTQGGNTQAMAEAVAEGIREGGKEAEVIYVGSVSADVLKDQSVFALGCPAMGAEVLEESEMEPFVAEVETFASGKKIGLFGSYGWGDGEWMRDWVDRMNGAGATVVGGEGVICQEAPDDEAVNNCKVLGKQLAAL
jgi:flavodoxin short chain